MAARPWTDDDDQRLRHLHDAETPVRRIAGDLGRSTTATARRLKLLGLTGVNRDRTAAATAARLADAKTRRADLRLNLLTDVERLREQLWQPTIVFNFGGKDNTYEERTLEKPPIVDQLKLVQAVSTGVGALERLEKMDADDGVTEAVGMLDQIAAAITAAADTMPDLDAP